MKDTISKFMEKWKNSPVVNSPSVQFLNISLTEHTIERYKAWKAECYSHAIEKQKAAIKTDDPFYSTYVACWEMGFPYEGAIGGGITFEISPTSLGHIIKARYDYTNETIDLTEYDLW